MHIRMLDKTAQLQQEAVGVLGINLIHACFTMGDNTAPIIGCLLEELSRARVEVSTKSWLCFDRSPAWHVVSRWHCCRRSGLLSSGRAVLNLVSAQATVLPTECSTAMGKPRRLYLHAGAAAQQEVCTCRWTSSHLMGPLLRTGTTVWLPCAWSRRSSVMLRSLIPLVPCLVFPGLCISILLSLTAF